MIAKKALYQTADRKQVVEEGHKSAAFLLVPAGQEIPKVVIEKYGLKDAPAPPAPPAQHPAPSTADIASRSTRVPPVPDKR